MAYLGPAPPGYQWHHIVSDKQISPELTSAYGVSAYIHNTNNMVLIPTIKHYLITGYLNSADKKNGGRVLDTLVREPLGIQRFVGLHLLHQFGVTTWPF